MSASPASFLFVFFDGVGVAPADPARNPFAHLTGGWFPTDLELGQSRSLPAGGWVKAIDANLEVPGLPQSATGQSSLFSGVNTSALLGHHLFAYPSRTVRASLMQHNLLLDAIRLGAEARFLNAYPGLDEILSPPSRLVVESDGRITAEGVDPQFVRRLSCTTVMALSIHRPFFGTRAMQEGRALAADFTQQRLADLGHPVPVHSVVEAGRVLARAASPWRVGLYEYFQTDRIGHLADLTAARAEAEHIQGFLRAVVEAVDLQRTTVVVSSDHGNLEDAATRGHTRNPVPLMTWGPAAEDLISRCDSILDVTPALLGWL